MALRAMYKGIKKVLAPLIINRPGELAIDQDALNTELNMVFFPRSEQAVLAAKNFLPLTLASLKASTSGGSWADNVYTNGNVAYTISTNSAGYVTDISATGTADLSNDSYFRLMTNLDSYLTVGVYYILNGCPEGGGANKYLLYTGSAGVWDDTGAGASKTYANTIKNLFIKIKGGTTVTNKSFKPMIRLGSDPDPTFAPYAMTNKELTDDVATLNGSASDQKTTINAIITAATGAADFAAFKTAMGAITPVTRSIQVTPETREEITEPEENPVKKTTRKKSTAKADTEKEGE